VHDVLLIKYDKVCSKFPIFLIKYTKAATHFPIDRYIISIASLKLASSSTALTCRLDEYIARVFFTILLYEITIS
jgi:hypothetical protein